MAKKDLRAQMDAARAAAAYIGAAQEDLAAPERGISPSGSSARSSEKDGAKAAPRRSRTHEVRSASLDVTQAAAMPDFFRRGLYGRASVRGNPIGLLRHRLGASGI